MQHTDVCIYPVVLRRRPASRETCHFGVINEDSYYVLRRDGAFLHKLVPAGYGGKIELRKITHIYLLSPHNKWLVITAPVFT